MQLVFLTTHLPSYLAICGMDPMLSAQALGMIGGFNVLGSLFFGWAGGRWNKQVLLGLHLYSARSLVLAGYFMAAPTPTSTLVFAAVMGFLWLGVAPLVAGRWPRCSACAGRPWCRAWRSSATRWAASLGAFGGGLIFDLAGQL
jgi:hypothetical protein